ncbi:MAG: diadenylate cyclase CdaA [Bacteroidota bacterium]
MGLEFHIGFLKVSLWDVLDVAIVAYLLYLLYKLLRGSIAFNIFIGLLLLYVSSFVVQQLKMELLSSILGEFVKMGIIILIIIFQPEVRRFLLILGNTTLRQRSNLLDRLLDRQGVKGSEKDHQEAQEAVAKAVLRMGKQRIGALIIITKNTSLEGIASGGVTLNAEISQPLLESLFARESPLHDGAVLLEDLKLTRASVILPVSEQTSLPKSVGLRHRAAVGVTEKAKVLAVLVSEETGSVSIAEEGQLRRRLSATDLRAVLGEWL